MNLTPSGDHFNKPDDAGAAHAIVWQYWNDSPVDWMTTQLDRAVAQGCNVVRAIGSVFGIIDGRYTRAQYLARWDELNGWCEDRGLYLYPCGQAGGSSDSFDTLTYTQFRDEMRVWAAQMNSYRRCIGIDLVQEDKAFALSTNGENLYLDMRNYTNLPLTYSMPGGADSQLDLNLATRNLLRYRVDFFDFHWYHTPAESDIEVHFRDVGEGRRILIGEFGENAAAGSAAQTARYEAVADCINYVGDSNRRPAGALAWCCTDFSGAAADQWGLYEADGDERTHITTPFQTISKT